MKNFLLSPELNYYKANLHCHTTVSDGARTPEEIKACYMARGYSAVAFTDHDKFVDQSALTDDKFVALNGFELEYMLTIWKGMTCHVNFIAKDPKNSALGWSDPEPDLFKLRLGEGEEKLSKGGGLYTVLPPYRPYHPDYINADIEAAKKLGFFVTYDHPSWSIETWPQYSRYRGFDAMEISNFNAINTGYEEDNGRVYNDFLRLGGRVLCIAADDNHNRMEDGHERSDSYGCYTMLGAESLSYENLIESLESGRFYSAAQVNPGAGEPPEIKALWTEDGVIHIETSPASNIQYICSSKPFRRATGPIGTTIEKAEFVPPSPAKWFRLVVTGMNGNKAYTNAYFPEEVFK